MSDCFPRDLHLEILKWLPLKAILQCRTVCKSWNSLITSNDFVSAHHNLTKSAIENGNQSLLIRYFDRTRKLEQYIIGKDDETFGLNFSNIEFQYASTSAYFRIVGYCDGVVCLSDDLFDSMYMVLLWNPSIRKSIRVMIPNHEQTCTQGTILGFGVCPKTHDPKIVRIMYVQDFSMPHMVRIQDSPPLVDVFSLSSGSWRNNHNCPHTMIRITWSQVCFNGVIHWVACSCNHQLETKFRCLIVSFDLVDEVFDEMPLPDVLARQQVSNLSISTRKGYLTILEYNMERGKESCGVWVMKEYGVMGSWEKLYIIHLPGVLRKVVGFRRKGEMVVALKNHELVTVESTGNIRSLDIYANIRSFFLGLHMESLILINQKDQQKYLVNGDDDDA